MNAIEILLMASYFDRQVKQGFAKRSFSLMVDDNSSTGKHLAAGAADIGASMFIPGYGTATMGALAAKDFAKGNYLGGAANVLGAGLSAVPVIGGAAGKAVGWGGGLLAKGFSRMGAPMLARGATGLGAAGQKALPWTGKQFSRIIPGAWGGAQKAIRSGIPTFGGARIANQMGNVGGMMSRHPIATGAVGIGASMGLGAAGEGAMEGRQMRGEQAKGMGDSFRAIHQRAVMTNPMYAGGRPWS